LQLVEGGTFGHVFSACHRTTAAIVAIKEPFPDATAAGQGKRY
jgi:hypothetical protein